MEALLIRLGIIAVSNWRKVLTAVLFIVGMIMMLPIMILSIMLPSTEPIKAEDYKRICAEGKVNWVEVMMLDMGRTRNEFEDITNDDILNSALEFYNLRIDKYIEEEREREVTKVDEDGNEYTTTETYYVWVKINSTSYTGSSIRSAIRRFEYSADSFDQIFSGVESIDGYTESVAGEEYKYETDLTRIEFPIVLERFDEDTRQWIIEVIDSGMVQDMFGAEGELSPEEIQDILDKLPDTGVTRENIVAIAESLVGKITYLWGGKADPPTVPTALDCSGFTDYVFKLAGAGTIGAGTYHQWENSYSISGSELQIGDLGFMKPPSQSSDASPNHVGIYVGDNAKGEKMFVHCEGGSGTIKTTSTRAGLSYFRRPFVKFDE